MVTTEQARSIDAPERAQDSALAEYAAQVCRRLAADLLAHTGDEVREAIARAAATLSSALETDGLLDGTEPVHPPRFDAKGRVQVVTNPVVGHRNAIAPPLTFHRHAAGESEFRVTLPLQYQGPRNALHGGYVAVLLDDVVWHAVRQSADGISYTRELTITYERPVPLFTELQILGRVTDIDGRKTFAEGEIVADGVVCARARGLWIAPKPRV